MDAYMSNWYLVIAALLFLIFLLWNGLRRAPRQMRRREDVATPNWADEQLKELLAELRDGAKLGDVLRTLKKRAREAESSKVRAAYLCAAGDVMRTSRPRKGAAVRYYTLALKQNPACQQARHNLRDELLAQRRVFRLEQVYWKVLAQMGATNDDIDDMLEVWAELVGLLEGRRTGRARAQALQHLIALVRKEDIEDLPF